MISTDDALLEINRLRAENARLRASIQPASVYHEIGVFTFKGKSQIKRENAMLDLPCHCKAYVDVLTAGRWRALGFHIRAGESACHRAGRRANTPVFCRCQVERDWQPVEIESTYQLAANEYGEVDITSIPF